MGSWHVLKEQGCGYEGSGRNHNDVHRKDTALSVVEPLDLILHVFKAKFRLKTSSTALYTRRVAGIIETVSPQMGREWSRETGKTLCIAYCA